MANTPIQAVYVATKNNYEPGILVRYPYVYDETAVPYLYMYEVDDPRNLDDFCASRGGEARITVGILAKDFDYATDQLEAVMAFLEALRGGNYAPIELTDVDVVDVRDLTGIEQSQQKLYRREFDIVVRWRQAS